jgi:hypothetical protein
MTDYNSSIGVGGGFDYSSPEAWEAGEQIAHDPLGVGDRVIGNVTGDVPCAGLVLGGWTAPDNSRKLILQAADGQKHTGKRGTGARIQASINVIMNGNTQAAGAPSIDLIGLEFDSNGTSNCHMIKWVGDSGAVDRITTIDSCIFYSNDSGSWGVAEGAALLRTNSRCLVTNTIFDTIERGVDGNGANPEDHVEVSFCTAYDCGGGYGTGYGYLRCLLTNCIAMSCSGQDFFSPETGSNYLVSSDTTANVVTNYAINKTSYSSYFTDPANGDFSLLDATNTTMGLAGTTIAGITVDIVETTRDSPPDVGAFEFPNGGDTGTTRGPFLGGGVGGIGMLG